MRKTMTINVAALCDKAGRRANQDNIYLSCSDSLHRVEKDGHAEEHGENIPIPAEGLLLVVADGMGGMNAGEIASQLVVETMARVMKDLAGQPLNYPERISAMARLAIVDADSAIKQYAVAHPEASGTGSTVVVLWLLGDKAVVAWCGDSRCYRYNPRRGLEQLSHDHSYVQQLVDQGKLPPEMAFGHHQSNIITRCLSDDPEEAQPDVKVIDVYRDDMFLLCSDGLCGLLPDDVMEQLIKDVRGNVGLALSNCWRRGNDKGWTDNCSIIIASVDGIDAVAPERKVTPPLKCPNYTTVTEEVLVEEKKPSTVSVSSPRRWLLFSLALLTIAVGVIVWALSMRQ